MTLTTGRPSNRAGAGASRGFTLLELVLVMLIGALIMALAAPSLNNFVRGRRSINAAGQILALAGYARTQAVATGAVYRLNVDTVDNGYFLSVQSGPEFVLLASDFGRVFVLPPEITARWKEAALSDDQHMDFFPDGRVRAGTLELTDREGRVTYLGCRSETEPLRVLSEEEGARR